MSKFGASSFVTSVETVSGTGKSDHSATDDGRRRHEGRAGVGALIRPHRLVRDPSPPPRCLNTAKTSFPLWRTLGQEPGEADADGGRQPAANALADCVT
jgi:hypothetical protein